jgi:hypothetical protein
LLSSPSSYWGILVYAVFDDWSCLRFLLPALAIFAVFAAVELSAWIDRWPWQSAAAAVYDRGRDRACIVVTRSMDTFKLADQLRRVSVMTSSTKTCTSGRDRRGEQADRCVYYTDRRSFAGRRRHRNR